MAGLRDNYQEIITPANLYEIRLHVQSGLGEALKPMIGAVGAAPILTLYGAFEEPTAVTLANITSKMILIKDDIAKLEAFDALPNYLAVILKSGTADSIVVSSINLEEDLGVIA